MMIRIVFLEIEDVLDLRSTECIDRLRVITHDTYVSMLLTQFLKYQILSEIGILILVYHDIVETTGNRLERLRIIP